MCKMYGLEVHKVFTVYKMHNEKERKKRKKMNINQTMRTFIRCKLNAYGLYHLICFERPRSRLNEIDTVGFEL